MTASLSIDLLDGRAARPSRRTRVLHLSSRAVLIGLLGVAGVGLRMATGSVEVGPPEVVSEDVDTRRVPGAVGGASSRTVSGTVIDLQQAVEAAGGSISAVRLENPRGPLAELTSRVDVPDDGSMSIVRLLGVAVDRGLADLRVEGVTASPGGSTLAIIGTVAPATVPRSAEVDGADGDLSVRLADLTAGAGAQLRRLDTSRTQRDGSVQLRATGHVADLAGLISRLEDSLSAPARIRSVRIERVGVAGEHQLDVRFVLRDVFVPSVSTASPSGRS